MGHPLDWQEETKGPNGLMDPPRVIFLQKPGRGQYGFQVHYRIQSVGCGA